MNEYSKVNWQDGTVLQPAKVTIDGVDHEVTPAVESGTTPVNATNLDKMDTALKQAHDGVRNLDANKIDKSTIELLTVDSVAPENCSEGDLYYNTTTNLIYTATATDTWSETGELPTSKYLYVDLTNSKLYYYDGTNFTSYGGGSSNDVIISDTQPTGDDWKLWIDKDEVENVGSEITNEYSTSTGLGYSANYINELVPNIQSGTVNFGIVNGHASTEQTITLSKPYSNTNYKVFCNFQNSGYYWELYSNFIIANKTTTGFEIQWKNNGSGNTNNDIYVSWLTIN